MLVIINSLCGKTIGMKNVKRMTDNVRNEIKEEIYAKHNGMRTTGFELEIWYANGNKKIIEKIK